MSERKSGSRAVREESGKRAITHGQGHIVARVVAPVSHPLELLTHYCTSLTMSGAASTKAPNQTLYVRNLPSKVKKLELRRQLFGLFVIYGKVLDVVATRRDGMREQAFVVFQDLASSTAALRALDGFMFYGKPLVSSRMLLCH